MANYAVDPALLRPRVPAGLELDLFERVALVSLVGFRFLRTRLLGVAVPFHRDFDEVNLRFYVRRRVDGGWRPGVVFVRELVARLALASTARVAYGSRGAVLGCPDGAHRRRGWPPGAVPLALEGLVARARHGNRRGRANCRAWIGGPHRGFRDHRSPPRSAGILK
jgi:Uncharacterized conserved protein (COG2071)